MSPGPRPAADFNATIERMYFPASFPGNAGSQGDGVGDPRRADYNATKPSTKRRVVPMSTKSEDQELPSEDRAQLITLGRDVRRNMAIAAWAIRKHLDFVSSFHFKATTITGAAKKRGKDKTEPDFDDDLEAFVKNWGKKGNFDVARRHGRERFLRILEAHRTIDGDVGVLKLASKKLQIIEGDRIRHFAGETEGDAWCHGVKTDAAGGDVAYAVGTRKRKGEGFEFERIIPVQNMILHGYFDRGEQTRGVSPLAPGLNDLRDAGECTELALAKMKAHQLFCMAIYSDAKTPVDVPLPGSSALPTCDDDEESEDEEEETDDEESEERYPGVEFDNGPLKLELQDKDRAELLESKTPSVEFQQFVNKAIANALKSLDIPFSFYDEAYTNYSGQKSGQVLYDESAAQKRRDNRELLDDLTRWRIALAVFDGELVLPPGLEFEDIKWEWVSSGLPWLDPLKEGTAKAQNRNNGFDSTPAICKATGKDAYAIVDEEAEYQAYRAARGLPSSLVPQGTVTIQEFSNAPGQ